MISVGKAVKGLKNPKLAARYVYNRRWKALEAPITKSIGWFPFNHDWKLLIVLDAFRYDFANESVAAERFGTPDKIWSVGANSPSWITRTFSTAPPSVIKNTAYISANPFTHRAPQTLGVRDDVLEYAFDKELGTIPPRPVTDRAITIGRETDFDRYIIHYMQPHLPPVDYSSDLTDFIPAPDEEDAGNPWRDVEEGIRDAEPVESAYRNNISTVVSEVELLKENFDAESTIITADHGNFLGELGRWGHRYGNSSHPAVRHVPYWEVSAYDEETHSPAKYSRTEEVGSRLDRLRALGYYE